jgi:hypothetical protein
MVNTYQLEVRAMCPHSKDLTDVYQVTLRTSAVIKAETIAEWFSQYAQKQILQEDLTHDSAVGLGCSVETIGLHGTVKITSVYP